MLSQAHRLTSGPDFATTIRRGRRAGTRTLVVHLAGGGEDPSSCAADPAGPARIGFVVSKAVGNAVVRNRVKRRLRHLAARRLDALPMASTLVVRALPAAATADSAALGVDLDAVLRRLRRTSRGGAAA
ncbi:MAG: ribonuclease P protein component [Nocardioidaceae bacterium]